MKKVLVVATSRKTRGGITSVIKAHETGEQWKKFHCRWIETHRDGNAVRKICYFITALMEYILLLPFYDIVHIHVASYPSLRRKRYFLLLAKLWHKKTIAHFHPHKPEVIFDKRHQNDYIYFFKSVDKIVVLSPQWQRWLKEALNITDDVQVIFNPCPIVSCEKADHSKKYILFAGTLYKRKGFDTLLKAFAKIAPRHKDWSIILAGNAKTEEDRLLINTLPKQLNIENQVEFPGWITGRRKDQIFRNSSIFCLASSGEGFPMAVLDAWAYGVPVVCTPVGGLPDIVEDGVNALLFNYGDDQTLAIQLEKLITDENLRTSIAKESLKLANTIFNVNNINKQIGEIYLSLSNE